MVGEGEEEVAEEEIRAGEEDRELLLGGKFYFSHSFSWSSLV